jgi:hypothetical protein
MMNNNGIIWVLAVLLACFGSEYICDHPRKRKSWVTVAALLVQAKHTFEKASAAGEEATRRLEDTYSRVALGTIDFHRKVLEIAQTNVDAAFDCPRSL